jgi:hypothetical protein
MQLPDLHKGRHKKGRRIKIAGLSLAISCVQAATFLCFKITYHTCVLQTKMAFHVQDSWHYLQGQGYTHVLSVSLL